MSTARIVTTTILAAVLASVGLTLFLASRDASPPHPSQRGLVVASASAVATPSQEARASSREPRAASSSPAAPPPAAGYPAAPSVRITLTCTVTYRNRGDRPADARITLPLPLSRPPFTEVGRPTLAPAAASQVTDAFGNRIATVELGGVPAGAARAVTLQVPVRIWQDVRDIGPAQLASHPPAGGLQRWLRAEAGLPVDDEAVRSTSSTLVAAEGNAWYRVVDLFDYTRSLDFALGQQARDVGQVLQSRVAQCSDASSLFITLARAAGVPARYVGGIYRLDETSSTAETHAWAEVFVAGLGWVPVDPTMARFDDAVRGSRLAEQVTGYVPLWEGTPTAFKGEVVAPADATWSAGDFEVGFSWRIESGSSTPSLLPRFPVPTPGTARRADAEAEAAWTSWKTRIDGTRGAAALDALAGSAAAEAPWLAAAVRGRCDMRAGRLSRAEAALQEARTHRPGPVTDVALADLYLWTHQLSRALSLLQEALQVDGASLLAWRTLVGAYASLEIWDGAALAAERAHAVLPALAEFPSEAGQAYMRLHDWQKARDAFRGALQLTPDDGWLHAMLGWALRECGDREGARTEVARGLALGVGDGEKAFFERMLAELR